MSILRCACRCTSAAGVGANYTVSVTVDGGASNASADALSYAPPVINSLSGPGALGASAAGGTVIVLNGSNFGPADGATVVQAWAIPSANSSLMFPASDCRVTTAHTAITCTVGPGVGAALTWRVVVEGLSNAVPQSLYSPPTLHGARWVGPGITAAATTGGTLLSLVGEDLGPSIGFVAVTVTVPAGDVPVPRASCSMPRPDREVVCALPPGTGAISRVGISVLDQSVWLPVSGLAYAPPVVVTVSPGTWSTDLGSAAVVVTVTGTGFGTPSLSSLVSARAVGVVAQGCGQQDTVAAITAQNVNVRSDTEVVFELLVLTSVPHMVPAWRLEVTVSGQGSEGGGVIVRSCALPRLGLGWRMYNCGCGWRTAAAPPPGSCTTHPACSPSHPPLVNQTPAAW